MHTQLEYSYISKVAQHDVNNNALQLFSMTYQILCNLGEHWLPLNPQIAFRIVYDLSMQ
jgi:hypothetical protein